MDNIEMINGEGSFASAREVPWHRLGVITDDAMTAQQALELAKLDWNVSLAPLQATIQFGEGIEAEYRQVPVPGKFATTRPDPRGFDPAIVLGVVGNRYTPVQNSEAFAFLDDLVEAAGGAHYETAGVLGRGERVFMTVKMPKDLVLDPNGAADKIEQYILVTNSHDGSRSFTCAVTPIRVVCQNTLTAALSGAKHVWTARHTKGITERAEEARRTLSLTVKYADELEAVATAMIQQSLTDAQFIDIAQRLYPEVTDATDAQKKRTAEHIGQLDALYRTAPTQENVRGTAWAGYNAVVEYEDFVREAKAGKIEGRADRRAESVIFGKAAQRKLAVFDAFKAVMA